MKKVTGYASTFKRAIKINGYAYVDSNGNAWIIFDRKSNPQMHCISNKWGCAEATTGLGLGKEFQTRKAMIEEIENMKDRILEIFAKNSEFIQKRKILILNAIKQENE